MAAKTVEELTGCVAELNTRITTRSETSNTKIEILTKRLEDLIKVLVVQVQHLETRAAAQHQQRENAATPPFRLGSLKFPAFTNGTDPEGWIFTAEQLFKLLGVLEAQKVPLAAFHLKGDSINWYRCLTRFSGELTWEQFSSSIRSRFCKYFNPFDSLCKLVQKGTVLEFMSEFEELLCLVPDLPESYLISLFLSGLRADIGAVVSLHGPASLEKAFDLARLQEEAIKAIVPKAVRDQKLTRIGLVNESLKGKTVLVRGRVARTGPFGEQKGFLSVRDKDGFSIQCVVYGRQMVKSATSLLSKESHMQNLQIEGVVSVPDTPVKEGITQKVELRVTKIYLVQ